MKRDAFPWEDRASLGFFPALGASLQILILSPTEAFSRISPDGAFLPPLLFGVLCLTVGSMANQVWSFAVRSAFGPVFEHSIRTALSHIPGVNLPSSDPVGQFGLMLQLALGLVFAPLVSLISLFTSSGLYHLVLILIRAPRKSFESTLAAVGYGSGAAAVLLLVPVLGWLVAWVLGIIYTAIGIRTLHGTTGGQAALVVILPMIVCCCLFIAGAAALGAVIGLIVAAASHAG